MHHHSLFTTTFLVPLRSLPRYIKKTLSILSLAGALILANPLEIKANPQGGVSVNGGATINILDPNRTVIDQHVPRAIINWQKFNIGAGQSVHFNQQAHYAILNRISDANPSQIFGSLSGAGKVFLINPNGILFGAGAQINVGSLIASTANISDQDFMNGKTHFNIASPNLDAMIDIERGATITVADGGLAAFVAPAVRNAGVIKAKSGTAILASGQTATMDLYGDGLVRIQVTKEVEQVPIDPNTGLEVDALVTNSGEIIADGGDVILTARAAKGLIDDVINTNGIIRARTATKQGNVIILGGEHGKVKLGGTIDVSGKNPGEKGGVVHVLSEDSIHIDGTTLIDASGDGGGGTILVGGEHRGSKFDPKGEDVVIDSKNPNKTAFGQPTDIRYIKDKDGSYIITNDPKTPLTGDIPQAKEVTIDAGAQFKVNATNNGDGGKAIFWSSDKMNFTNGQVDASAGSNGGDGGFIEISAKGKKAWNVILNPTDLLRSSPKGKNGMVFFDPDGTIGAVEAAALVATLGGGDATFAVTGLLTIAADIIIATTNTLFLEGRAITQGAGIDISLGPAGSVQFDYNLLTSDAGTASVSLTGTSTITAGGGIDIVVGPGNGGTTLGTSSLLGTFDSVTGITDIDVGASTAALDGATFTAGELVVSASSITSTGTTFPVAGIVRFTADTWSAGGAAQTLPTFTTAPRTGGGTLVGTGTSSLDVTGAYEAVGNTSLSFDSFSVAGATTVPSGTTLSVGTSVTGFDSESGGYSGFNGTKSVSTGTFFVQSPATPFSGTGDLFITATTVSPSIGALVSRATAAGFGGTITVNGVPVYPPTGSSASSASVINLIALLNVLNNIRKQQDQYFTGVWQTANVNNPNTALTNLGEMVPTSPWPLSIEIDNRGRASLVRPDQFTESFSFQLLNTRPQDPAAILRSEVGSLQPNYTQNGIGSNYLSGLGPETGSPIFRDRLYLFGASRRETQDDFEGLSLQPQVGFRYDFDDPSRPSGPLVDSDSDGIPDALETTEENIRNFYDSTGSSLPDGATEFVDLDEDGLLDAVIVSGVESSREGRDQTQQVIVSALQNYLSGQGQPQTEVTITDTDEDGMPDLVVQPGREPVRDISAVPPGDVPTVRIEGPSLIESLFPGAGAPIAGSSLDADQQGMLINLLEGRISSGEFDEDFDGPPLNEDAIAEAYELIGSRQAAIQESEDTFAVVSLLDGRTLFTPNDFLLESTGGILEGTIDFSTGGADLSKNIAPASLGEFELRGPPVFPPEGEERTPGNILREMLGSTPTEPIGIEVFDFPALPPPPPLTREDVGNLEQAFGIPINTENFLEANEQLRAETAQLAVRAGETVIVDSNKTDRILFVPTSAAAQRLRDELSLSYTPKVLFNASAEELRIQLGRRAVIARSAAINVYGAIFGNLSSFSLKEREDAMDKAEAATKAAEKALNAYSNDNVSNEKLTNLLTAAETAINEAKSVVGQSPIDLSEF